MAVSSYQRFHEKTLGASIFPFLPIEDRGNLGLTDRTWREAKIDFEKPGYEVLKDRIRERGPIYRRDGNGLHQEMLLGVLGKGGSKKAIKLQEGRALLVPNMDHDCMNGIVMRWRRMVYEEVAMSQLLPQIGLLSPLYERVNLSISEDPHEEPIPAYLAESFENLKKTKGWSIIDTKDFNYSTWEQGEDHLFSSTEDRLNEKNWDSVLDAILTDIAKITVYRITAGRDSLNIAIMKKPSELNASQYEIRYFGFDFSHKYRRLTIPRITISDAPDVARATEILSSVLNHVFDYEFGAFWNRSNKIATLKNQLVEKNIKEIIARMNKLSG